MIGRRSIGGFFLISEPNETDFSGADLDESDFAFLEAVRQRGRAEIEPSALDFVIEEVIDISWRANLERREQRELREIKRRRQQKKSVRYKQEIKRRRNEATRRRRREEAERAQAEAEAERKARYDRAEAERNRAKAERNFLARYDRVEVERLKSSIVANISGSSPTIWTIEMLSSVTRCYDGELLAACLKDLVARGHLRRTEF